ncbi:hypothetical protein ACFSCZ_13775 [Siminovitchia sediminis]|uniref:Uncharacterized protein n=1 Tax=Siminovitchia sediminis TaxID=1274353 RepID=A0ABW4KIK4_9BACI
MSKKGQYQNGEDQYKMPKALQQERKFSYRVGYTATSGNDTGGKDEPGKRTDQP